MSIEDYKDIYKAGVSIMMDAALEIIQSDPHQWGTRPCGSCKTVSALIGKPFGCYEHQRVK